MLNLVEISPVVLEMKKRKFTNRQLDKWMNRQTTYNTQSEKHNWAASSGELIKLSKPDYA